MLDPGPVAAYNLATGMASRKSISPPGGVDGSGSAVPSPAARDKGTTLRDLLRTRGPGSARVRRVLFRHAADPVLGVFSFTIKPLSVGLTAAGHATKEPGSNC
jgi:hypothetical protein